jgi:hypothetical protein
LRSGYSHPSIARSVAFGTRLPDRVRYTTAEWTTAEVGSVVTDLPADAVRPPPGSVNMPSTGAWAGTLTVVAGRLEQYTTVFPLRCDNGLPLRCDERRQRSIWPFAV